MKPEELARIKIDGMLKRAGWDVVSRNEFCDSHNACAITEALLNGNKEADYLLMAGGKAIGVLEAKRAESKLSADVANQAENYARKVPEWCAKWFDNLPFVFLSNGDVLLFRDMRDIKGEYEKIDRMMTPKELVRRSEIKSEYAALPCLPPVGERGLRQCQYDAIRNLECSFKNGRTKALVSLATGAGKTFTACTFTYRFLTYTSVRRVLFLVDRNNLGKQAEGEFKNYSLTESGEKFNSIYAVQRLRSIEEIESSRVVISTIQRLFSALTGRKLDEENDDDESDFDDAMCGSLADDEVKLEGDLCLKPDFFDMIIVDECHRSIYGKWQQVLKYFKDAKIIGLTATPTPEAVAFFDGNFASNYTFEDSVRDGVNVPPRVYRIRTKVSESGGVIAENEAVYKTSKYTNSTQLIANPAQQEYSYAQLDRSVVNKAQIRQVVQAFKDSVYLSLYPDRYQDWRYVPKTLFFAKTDSHASDIVEQIKDVFGKEFPNGLPNGFVQKITYSAGNSNELIRQFRNDVGFRIAVTVTLVATGTDVRALECVVFMRDVNSLVLYTQMKGRGCRRISDDNLQQVTPNASSKDCFYIVDAVGVTEHEHSLPEVAKRDDGDLLPVPSLERLLELLSHGNVSDEYLTLLSNYISKCVNKAEQSDLDEWAKLAGISLKAFLEHLDASLSAPASASSDASSSFGSDYVVSKILGDNRNGNDARPLPPYMDVNEPNTERKLLIAPLVNNIAARNKLLEINAGFVKTLIPGEDELVYSGFSREESETYINSLVKYLNDNKDKIEALRIIYNEEDIAITHDMLMDLQKKLLAENASYRPGYIWQNYRNLMPEVAIPLESRNELEALTNLIQIARFAYGKTNMLVSLFRGWRRGFNLYVSPLQRTLTSDQRKLMEAIGEYIVQNGATTQKDVFEGLGSDYAVGLAKIFGAGKVDGELDKLARFVLRDYRVA